MFVSWVILVGGNMSAWLYICLGFFFQAFLVDLLSDSLEKRRKTENETCGRWSRYVYWD